MAQGILRVHGQEKLRVPVVANNSDVFAENSPVFIDSDGFLAISSTTNKIWGYCKKAFTALAANETGTGLQTTDSATARYAPPVIEPDNVDFWADADEALTQTSVGTYADIASVAAGVVTLNLVGGSTGQFHVLGLLADFDPNFTGDTLKIVVRAAEPQDSGFAQT